MAYVLVRSLRGLGQEACPPGTGFNVVTGECEPLGPFKPEVPVCGPGTEYSPETGKCEDATPEIVVVGCPAHSSESPDGECLCDPGFISTEQGCIPKPSEGLPPVHPLGPPPGPGGPVAPAQVTAASALDKALPWVIGGGVLAVGLAALFAKSAQARSAKTRTRAA